MITMFLRARMNPSRHRKDDDDHESGNWPLVSAWTIIGKRDQGLDRSAARIVMVRKRRVGTHPAGAEGKVGLDRDRILGFITRSIISVWDLIAYDNLISKTWGPNSVGILLHRHDTRPIQ